MFTKTAKKGLWESRILKIKIRRPKICDSQQFLLNRWLSATSLFIDKFWPTKTVTLVTNPYHFGHQSLSFWWPILITLVTNLYHFVFKIGNFWILIPKSLHFTPLISLVLELKGGKILQFFCKKKRIRIQTVLRKKLLHNSWQNGSFCTHLTNFVYFFFTTRDLVTKAPKNG